MQFAYYALDDDEQHLIARRGDDWVDLTALAPKRFTSIHQLLLDGEQALAAAREALAEAPPFDPGRGRLLPPLTDPDKILCIGLNYAEHARETGKEPPAEPLIFNKLRTALCASEDEIPLPPESDQVDYEAELVAVIGRGGRRIPRETALAHVAGYCCGCDVTARDWQKGKPGGQWLLGKSFDRFAPLGPTFVTADEIPDPHALPIELRLNGEVMQRSTTADLIFPIDELIAYISQVCTLAPGDLIFTGTPSGVGVARDPQRFMRPGDVIEVEIGGVGLLRNRFV